MNRTALGTYAVAAAVLGFVACSPAPRSTEETAEGALPAEEMRASQPQAGRLIYRDPQTGRIGPPPPGWSPPQPGPELREDLSRSSEGLAVVPSKVPGGGIMVDLKGRFRSTMAVALDEAGNPSVACDSNLPGSAQSE